MYQALICTIVLKPQDETEMDAIKPQFTNQFTLRLGEVTITGRDGFETKSV